MTGSQVVGRPTVEWALDSTRFRAGMANLNRQMRVTENEFRLSATRLGEFGSSTERLGLRATSLSRQLELQRQRVNALQTAYAQSVETQGENSVASQNLQNELLRAQRREVELEQSLNRTNRELQVQSSRWNRVSQTLAPIGERFSAIGGKLKAIGGGLSTYVTLPLIGVAASSFKMASDMAESVNKVDTVFKNNSKVVQKWADTSLEKMGMAKSTALEMSALFGDMGSGMGLNAQDNLKYSMSLTRLAADMASFKNVKVDVAKTALQSIYTGETESLKQLGVVMTEANLQEYAYSQGIKKKIQSMTQVEKVQLRYNYVLSKTKNAQGDFEKTNKSSSNQLKIFSESMKQLGQTIGDQIIPILLPFIQKANDMVKSFSKMDAGTKKLIVVLGGIAAVIGPIIVVVGSLVSAIGTIITAFSAVSGAVAAAGGAMAIITGPIGLTIAAIAGLAAVGYYVYDNWAIIKTKMSSLWNSIKSITVRVWDGIKLFFKKWWPALLSAFGPVGLAVTMVIKNWDKIRTATTKTFNTIKTGIGKAWEGVKSVTVNIWNGIVNSIRSAINRVISGINRMINAMNGIKFKAPDWVPGIGGKGWSPNIPNVPMLASGGIVTKPTLALIGEAGPEAVVPLSKYKSNNPNQANVTNHFTIQATIREEADIDKVAYKLYKLQRGTLRAQGAR